MTADEFRAIRIRMVRTQQVLASELGVSSAVVNEYERGVRRVPWDIGETMRRMDGAIGTRCRCGNRIVAEFHDRRCGACTKPLPESAHG